MERLSIFFFSLFSLAVLAESTSAGSSTTTETSRSNGCDARNVIEKPHVDLLKSKGVKNDSECSLVNQSHVKAVSFSNNYTKDVQYTKRIENREDDASPSYHKDRSHVDLSSHNISLLDSSDLISARLSRQVEKSDMDYSNPSSVEDISVEPVVESENIGSSQESSDLKGDLGVAEDRYRFQYPYWYRGQFANQRYRAYDRREPYRNYLRYPVFPGK
ncbi:unnamed protein product [Lasius platythorax]|uniref:Uncharacterized protein n=1 Tax=Lasius platythorax TaxID=488582 RepID=A0AAV2NB28_9HYME